MIVAKVREWRMTGGIAERQRALDVRDPQLRAKRQLMLLNRCWIETCRSTPFYHRAVVSGQLPCSFTSLDEFVSVVPPTARADVRNRQTELTANCRPPEWYRTTGGSTAEPIQMPSWHDEHTFTSSDLWLARSWYGIRPADRQFMIWGHAHLLGSGFQGFINKRTRILKDRLLGYYRFSAYDLTVERLRNSCDELLFFKPSYVLGYSVALDAFARVNADRHRELRRLGVKAVIGAAEAFPFEDSIQRVADVFGAPVAMEYGSVETALIAHTVPTGGYDVFWETYFVEVTDSGAIRVTSLYPRCFPLVRYELGDELVPLAGADPYPLYRLERVRGRCNDFVTLASGARIHSEAVTHVVRSCPGLAGYQWITSDDGTNELRLRLAKNVSKKELDMIRVRLRRIHPELSTVNVSITDQFITGMAGKTPMVVRRASGSSFT